MKIVLNGAPHELTARDVAAALDELGYDPGAAVATALNGDFLPREARADAPLAEGDRLEVISPRQGG